MAYRLLKWVGDPQRLKADGFSVANWKYEQHRAIALPGLSARMIKPYDVLGKDHFGREVRRPNGLKREYYWSKNLPGFVLEVDAADAEIILKRAPHEFVDVTGIDDPTYIHSDLIIGGRVYSGQEKRSEFVEVKRKIVDEGVRREDFISGRNPTPVPEQ